MLSPDTGKLMKLVKQKRNFEFRKHSFEILHHAYVCESTGNEYTTTELDELNVSQVHDRYRSHLNIPFPEEIHQTRMKYGISATKMSQILGFGVNSYRQYEAGEIPNLSNARLIRLASKPDLFLEMVDSAEELSETDRKKIREKVRDAANREQEVSAEKPLWNYLLGEDQVDIFTGYRKPDLVRLSEMIKFFAEKCAPYKTKLNKLLFYADFYLFRKQCRSMSGVRYRAIPLGPVPNHYESIYEFLQNTNAVESESNIFPDGYTGEKFISKNISPFDESLFSNEELDVLREVALKFGDTTTSELIEISHNERAWTENIDGKKFISYEFAFYME